MSMEPHLVLTQAACFGVAGCFLCRTNVGNSTSARDNGFIVVVPTGVDVPAGVTLTPTGATPPAQCVRTEVAGATALNCTVPDDLAVGQTWGWTFPATGGTTAGNFTATVSLTKPDSNPANDKDDAPVTLLPVTFVDVAVNITATPVVGPGGSNITYTVNL